MTAFDGVPAAAGGDNGRPMTAPADLSARVQALQANVESVVRGKSGAVRLLLAALLARGHALIEDIPGVGKTTLARALAQSIACTFRRVQLTSDLLPSDLIGVSIYRERDDAFQFRPGPIFANIVLADEINRTPPRTQSALLEAMNDGQVSVDGHTHPLPRPFLVIATQNPLEHAGTYPLPDSQLDRFLVSFEMGYPDERAERAMLGDQADGHPLEKLAPVLGVEELLALQEAVKLVRVHDDLVTYVLRIAAESRRDPELALGASPRATLALRRLAQAAALLDGRDHVRPDDVKSCAVPALAHRLVPRDAFGADRAARVALVRKVLDRVPVPV
jgi:MoxR-like ATPase